MSSGATYEPVERNSVIRNARHNDAMSWVRFPVSVIVSGFLFVFVSAMAGWIWLSLMLVLEIVAWWIRKRLVAGNLSYRIPHLLAVGAIALGWVAHAVLLWQSGSEVARMATIVELFSVAMIGVIGGYKSRPILVVLVTPPLLALTTFLSTHAWSVLDTGPALLTIAATLGSCGSIALSGWALHRSDNQLIRAVGELDGFTKRLETLAASEKAANQAKDYFLANVSHEIRTPLNGIIGMASTFDTQNLSNAQREMMEVICSSGEVLERLISDLLDLSAIEAGKLKLTPRPFDLVSLVRSVVVSVRPAAEAKGLRIGLQAKEMDDLFVGDDVRVRQILLNLLANAVKYTPSGQIAVAVGLERPLHVDQAPRVFIDVSDTGVGLDEGQLSGVFERFDRGALPAGASSSGLGLGLSIARSLAIAMNGDIEVSSTVGIGSRFRVILPLPRAITSVDPQHHQAAEPVGSAMTTDGSRPLRVLVVEDNAANRRVMGAILEALGAEPHYCGDGYEALEEAARGYDLILMDWWLPHLDGLEATRRIRAAEVAEARARTPIIMVTASVLPNDVARAHEAGCDAHLAKPLTPGRVLETLRLVLAK